jgi:lysophospholipase L1-like esterase
MALASSLVLTLALVIAAVEVDSIAVNNLELGFDGFPDCVQTANPGDDVATTLKCTQRPKVSPDQISIACVGDSITAGAHSSGQNATYPSRLQDLLGDKYVVTNLGASGSTMLKNGSSPYWKRPQYRTLVAAKWDIVIIMLGTNDAKTFNFPHNCSHPDEFDACTFTEDYGSMISLVRTLGTTSQGPVVHLMVPPPLMLDDAGYHMNSTVINDVYPLLIPFINKKFEVRSKPVDIFDALGGADKADFPAGGCTLNTSSVAGCKYFCDPQSCDQCHPNDVGYVLIAKTVHAAVALS